mgnify:CR=1 FL=1
MEAILAELAAVPDSRKRSMLPADLPRLAIPTTHGPSYRRCSIFCPSLAARLTLVFRDAGSLDFTQGMLGALDALGTEETPSDLLLALDLRIDHLLIDEFQDTSFTQLELLRRLTAGWQQGDGRTLFAVGDPMQSIYRFREAEVRIFVDAQAQREIAGVPVECLVLARNFRSHAGIVTWVNDVFHQVLGSRSDPWRGMVAYAPAHRAKRPHRPARGDARHRWRTTVPKPIASSITCGLALQRAKSSIAILVRARTNLEQILPALREAGIAYAAVGLDALAERQAILDLVSLTHALVQPADRFAWLAVLRAPWCGLALHDLVALVAAVDAEPSRTVAALLEAPEGIAGLSVDGRERLINRRRNGCWAAIAAARPRAACDTSAGCMACAGRWRNARRSRSISARPSAISRCSRNTTSAGDISGLAGIRRGTRRPARRSACRSGGARAGDDAASGEGARVRHGDHPGARQTPRNRGAEVLRLRVREQGLLLAPMRARAGTWIPSTRT